MSFPVGTPTVTLVGKIPSAVAGTAYAGKLVAKPSAYLIDSSRHAVYPGGGSVTFAGDGTFSVVLLPSDTVGVQPEGWKWFFDLQPTGGKRVQFFAEVNGTGTVHFDDLVPIPAPGGGPSNGAGTGAVSSVNGQTGAVVLDAEDVDADPEGTAAAVVAAHAVATDPHGDRAAAAAALASHEADTTSVHGITNTAALETQTGAQAKADAAQAAAASTAAADATSKVATHEADTTAVHGIANTALLETAAGAQSKADAAQAAAISTAATDATSKVTTHAGAADPHGDRADAASKYLAKTANLSDVNNAATARTSLGLGGAAVLSVGTATGTVAAGDDIRFTAIGNAASPFPGDVPGFRTNEVRITDGAVQDLASAAAWTIAATSVGTQLKCSIPAEVGDRIRVDVGMLYSGTRYLDAVLLDSAGAINLYAGTQTGSPLTEGNPEFYPSTSFGKASSGILFTVAAGHLSGGQATVALANQGTGAGRIYAFSGYPFRLTLTNIGPAPAPNGISVAQTSTPTSGYIKYAPAGVTLSGSDVTGPFSYLGAGGFQIGTGTPDSTYVLPTTRYPNTRGTLSSSQSIYSIEFGTDATAFQLRFNWQTGGSYRLWVDGRRMTDLMQSLGGTTLGSTHLMTINLGVAQPRVIRFDFAVAPFGGVYLPPGATMWKPPAPASRIMVLGDSIPGGSSLNTGGGAGTWLPRAARLLGYSDIWNEALGGTGYITPSTTATLGTRAPIDVIPNNPDVLIISAGYNDNGGSQPSISSAAASLYSAIKAGLPSAKIYVIGCWSPSGSPAASITNTDNTLKAAAAAAALPFISPLTGGIYDSTGTLIATHGPWITGTGRVGATTGSGNADIYIGTDATHPTDAGHTYLASRVVAAIRELAA
ncbi:SGNH/GDSL hydrolase family protein [Streptomyces sp. NPDC006544]|uniref:SGNH/GDSL hydrolase family protein n=1 Tax=Streptomyces sp. NPDC006544 TaxID=3154583 RepID=UPI0033A556A5